MSTSNALVRAAGFLIYRKRAGKIEYLLLQASYKPFHWTPPKGHVDPEEDEWTAALREVEEEAGIGVDKLIVHKDFAYEMFYTTKSNSKHGAEHKKVLYWLAGAKDSEIQVTLSNEHKAWRWVEFSKAIELTKFEEMQKLLNKAESYLSTENK